MIRVVCGCGRVFKAEARHSGKRTRCPVCGTSLIIGQTPASSSSEGDLDEVPSWWYPSDPQDPFESDERTAGRRRRPGVRCERRSCRRSPSRYRGGGTEDARGGQAPRRRAPRPTPSRRGPAALDPGRGSWRRRPCWSWGCWVWMRAASPGRDERPPARGLAAPRDGPGAGGPGGRGCPRSGRGLGRPRTGGHHGPHGCDCSCPPTSTRRAMAASNGAA